jgi:hypothetical protein
MFQLLALCKKANYRTSYSAWKVAEMADLYALLDDNKNAHACVNRSTALIQSLRRFRVGRLGSLSSFVVLTIEYSMVVVLVLLMWSHDNTCLRAYTPGSLYSQVLLRVHGGLAACVCPAACSAVDLDFAKSPEELSREEALDYLWVAAAQLSRARLADMLGYDGEAGELFEQVHSVVSRLFAAAASSSSSSNASGDKLNVDEVMPHMMAACNNFGAFCAEHERLAEAAQCFAECARVTESAYRVAVAVNPSASLPHTVLARQHYLKAHIDSALALSRAGSHHGLCFFPIG